MADWRSLDDVAKFARGAGFSGLDVQTAVAVAMAESGNSNPLHPMCDAQARLLTSREDSRGLWQINTFAHPDATGNLYDPAYNAQYAFGLKSKQGWSPWSTFNSGAYLAWMPAAEIAVVNAGGQTLAGDTASKGEQTGIATPAQAFLDVLKTPLTILTFLEQGSTWTRIAKFGIGGLLLVAAGFVFIQAVAAPAAVGAAGKTVGVVSKTRNVGNSVKNVVK